MCYRAGVHRRQRPPTWVRSHAATETALVLPQSPCPRVNRSPQLAVYTCDMRPIILCILVCFAGAMESPKFETASIAPSHSGSAAQSMKVQVKPEPVTLTMRNASLRFCVQQAYAVKAYQVAGPGWINNRRYDIAVTLPPAAPPDQFRPALQSLLEDRLKLTIRREKKELSIYALTVAPGGSKLHPAAASRAEGRDPEETPPSGTALRRTSASVEMFCDDLSRKSDRPVVDATGIPGLFDFELEYGDSGPKLSTALEHQLGLKLEPRKASIEILFVDAALRKPVMP